MVNPPYSFSSTGAESLSPNDLQILDGIARHAPVPYRPSSILALRGLVVGGTDGFAMITDAGRRELASAMLKLGRMPPPAVDEPPS